MVKREAKFQSIFNRWLRHYWNHTSAFELKIALGSSLPFAAVKKHQVEALTLAAKNIVYKIPDDSRSQKPFDCFKMVNANGYVVIYFQDRSREFFIIHIDDWTKEMKESDRKSLTKDRARVIADIVGYF